MSEANVQAEPQQPTVDSVRIMFGLGGLLALIIGILIMINPVKSGVIMMQIVGAVVALYMVGTGIVYLGSAVFSKSMKGWPRTGNIILGLLYVIAGIVLFGNLAATAAILAMFVSVMIGVLWIIEGALVFSTIKTSGHKALAIVYGIISVLAGLVLIFVPLMAAVTLWLLIGISMVVLGLVQVVRAFTITGD